MCVSHYYVDRFQFVGNVRKYIYFGIIFCWIEIAAEAPEVVTAVEDMRWHFVLFCILYECVRVYANDPRPQKKRTFRHFLLFFKWKFIRNIFYLVRMECRKGERSILWLKYSKCCIGWKREATVKLLFSCIMLINSIFKIIGINFE